MSVCTNSTPKIHHKHKISQRKGQTKNLLNNNTKTLSLHYKLTPNKFHSQQFNRTLLKSHHLKQKKQFRPKIPSKSNEKPTLTNIQTNTKDASKTILRNSPGEENNHLIIQNLKKWPRTSIKAQNSSWFSNKFVTNTYNPRFLQYTNKQTNKQK